MQLTKTTDYAVRIVYFLSNENQIFTSEEISKSTGIPKNYLMSILRKLSSAGLVKVIRGAKGGFYLDSMVKISLYDVIKTMEANIYINQCLGEVENCNLLLGSVCPVRKFYLSLQEHIESELKNMTFEKLKNQKKEDIK